MNDQTAFVRLSIDQFMQAEASGRKTKKAPHKLVKKYGTILDNFNDVIVIIDKAGHFVFVNKASERRTGIPTQTFIGRHFLELIDPEYHEFAQSSFQKAMTAEERRYESISPTNRN